MICQSSCTAVFWAAEGSVPGRQPLARGGCHLCAILGPNERQRSGSLHALLSPLWASAWARAKAAAFPWPHRQELVPQAGTSCQRSSPAAEDVGLAEGEG